MIRPNFLTTMELTELHSNSFMDQTAISISMMVSLPHIHNTPDTNFSSSEFAEQLLGQPTQHLVLLPVYFYAACQLIKHRLVLHQLS